MRQLGSEDGFAVFEAVLAALLIVVLGVVGYFAYHGRQDKTDYSVNISHKKQPTATTTQPTPSSTAQPAPTFALPEWGVKFPYSNSPQGLTYQYGDHGGVVNIVFDSKYLTGFANARDRGNWCDDDALGTLSRDTSDASSPAAGPVKGLDGQTYPQSGLVAHVGAYYYQYSFVQNDCSGNTEVQQKELNEAYALVDALKGLQAQ